MSDPRKINEKAPAKIPALVGDLATPKHRPSGRHLVTADGSPLPKSAMRSFSASPAPARRGRKPIFSTQNKEGTMSNVTPIKEGTPPMYRSVSASMAKHTPHSVKRSHADREITNSDEELSAKRQPPPKRQEKSHSSHKETGFWKYAEDVHIGHHTDWSEVKVWANVNGGGILIVRAKKDKTAPDVVAKAWPKEFRFDSKKISLYLALEKVEIKLEIAKYFTGDLDKATKETKRDLILEYLAAKHEGRQVRIITEQSPGAEAIPDIRVGSHRHYGTLASVYAFVSNGHVRFRLHEDEIRLQCGLLLPKMAVDYYDIAFSLEYQYCKPEDAKDYIKGALTKLECPEPDGTLSTDGNGAFPTKPLDVILGAEEDEGMIHALLDFENAGKRLKAETEKREEALSNRHAGLTKEKENLILQQKVLDKREKDLHKLAKVLEDKEQFLNGEEKRLKEQLETLEEKEQMLKEQEDRQTKVQMSLDQRKIDLDNERDQQVSRGIEIDRQQADVQRREANLDREDREAAAIANSDELTRIRDKYDILEGIVKQREDFIKEKEAERNDLAKTLRAKEEEITANGDELTAKNNENVELKTQKDNLAKELAIYKNPIHLRLDHGLTFENSFTKLHDENPNAGMFVEDRKKSVVGKGRYADLKFLAYRTLQFPAVKVDGTLIQSGFDYGGFKFSVYEKDGLIKMVQDLQPGMLRQQDGQVLITYSCLKQEPKQNIVI
ncbi:uncharacterized protein PAC_01717 [Phialocephala subalpina]|uniref:Uncharacterized protein n=1 Tax=Phialocephala subalpina TaxID=576137 RepID=A0A1L7WGD1_9HELO|nr:uncharacterized protein PAC_01717 [Phialocephala subalpina]